ncbi:hypothetical protein [Curtobacterium caseinilyticum]|uniref:Uncharacterized protein n=1 Tax=Curtobacterium caseinilyticum TaxID=3055137 RepID=A0ABT7TTK6_9MICO|nr:hypothetical protein [Curtobacterium caseinilyticum]MDM7892947.1 hypothetical protein [Curtobacterium caseinilyticum]
MIVVSVVLYILLHAALMGYAAVLLQLWVLPPSSSASVPSSPVHTTGSGSGGTPPAAP